MLSDEKKIYIMKLLMGIGLSEKKITIVAQDIDSKTDEQGNEMILKLESYYINQEVLDKDFIKNLERINNQIDESIESTIDTFNIDNFNF